MTVSHWRRYTQIFSTLKNMGDYQKRLAERIQTKGPKVGFCTICRVFGNLTVDHVPPQGCHNVSKMVIQSVLPSTNESSASNISQSGTKFRTLCADCNNKKLGASYDPSLIAFVNSVIRQVRFTQEHRQHLPPVIHVTIRPQRIARAIIGHLLAANAVKEVEKNSPGSELDELLRNYFLDPSISFPVEWDLYFWPYFSRRQIVLKYLSLADTSSPNITESSILGHVIKFLPLGFWLVLKQPHPNNIHLPNIFEKKDARIDDEFMVSMDLRNAPPMVFPESPTGNYISLFANAFTYSAEPHK